MCKAKGQKLVSLSIEYHYPLQMEDAPSRALESTKSRLVFGTVAVGGSSGQKLILRNTSTTHKLSLALTILGSQDFQVNRCLQDRYGTVDH